MRVTRNMRVLVPFFIILIGLIGALVIVASKPTITQRPVSFPLPLVRAQTVHIQETRLTVISQGTVTPRTETAIVSEVSGTIVSISSQFAPGGFFRKDELFIQIDSRDYEYALERLEAEVAQARLRLQREEEEATIARAEWERIGGSREASPLVLRKPQLEEARALLKAAEASVKQAKLNLVRTRIIAPYAGRVREKNADIGQYVSPGYRLGTVYSVDSAEVRLPVPDKELAYLDVCLSPLNGHFTCPILPVTLSAHFAGDTHTWQGTIARIEGEIDPMTRMVTLVCSVEDPYNINIRAQKAPLAVGMFVDAEIAGKVVANAAVIERSAIRDSERVLVIDSENRLRYRKVNVVKTNARTLIVSKGLDQGDRVCISPCNRELSSRNRKAGYSGDVEQAAGYQYSNIRGY